MRWRDTGYQVMPAPRTMDFIGPRTRSRSSLLQAFKLCNAGHPPVSMALLQLSDCRLLEPIIHRAIPDGLNVAFVLEVNVGEGCPKRLQQG